MSDSGCGDLDEKCPPRLWSRNIWTPAGAGGEVWEIRPSGRKHVSGTGWEGKSLVPPPISSAPLAGEDVSSSPCSRHMACHSLLCLPALTASYPSGMGTKTHPSFHERLLSQCFIRATEKYPSTQGVTVPPQGRLTSVSCTQIAYLSGYCPMIKINNIYL